MSDEIAMDTNEAREMDDDEDEEEEEVVTAL